MKDYCYLALVCDGERSRVVKIGKSQRNLQAGDFIRLRDGWIWEILHMIYTETDGDCYAFISAIKPIEDDWIECYLHGGRRDESNEPT